MSEEEEEDHGDRPTMIDMYAANAVRDNQNMRAATRYAANNQYSIMANETMMNREDDMREVDHGNRPTMTDMYAATEVRDKQNMRPTNRHGASNQYSSMANETMMNNEDDMSVGTTQSADTVKRSNCKHHAHNEKHDDKRSCMEYN